MPGEMLFVRGDCLVDPRLFAALLARTSPYWLPAPRATADPLPAAARLSRAQLDTWATAGLKQWLPRSPKMCAGSASPLARPGVRKSSRLLAAQYSYYP